MIALCHSPCNLAAAIIAASHRQNIVIVIFDRYENPPPVVDLSAVIKSFALRPARYVPIVNDLLFFTRAPATCDWCGGNTPATRKKKRPRKPG